MSIINITYLNKSGNNSVKRHSNCALRTQLSWARRVHFLTQRPFEVFLRSLKVKPPRVTATAGTAHVHPHKSSRVCSTCTHVKTNCASAIPTSGHPIQNAGMAFRQTPFALMRASQRALPSATRSARRVEVIKLWTPTALASGRSHHSSALKLSPIPVMIDAFVPLGDQEFR